MTADNVSAADRDRSRAKAKRELDLHLVDEPHTLDDCRAAIAAAKADRATRMGEAYAQRLLAEARLPLPVPALSPGQVCRIAAGFLVMLDEDPIRTADQMAVASDWATFFESGIAVVDEDEPNVVLDEPAQWLARAMAPLARGKLFTWTTADGEHGDGGSGE